MYSFSQKTIKDSIELDGVGLHNGKNVNICLKSAEVDSGIKFKRTDINNTNNIIDATSAGFKQRLTFLPLCNPTPSSSMESLIVFCEAEYIYMDIQKDLKT